MHEGIPTPNDGDTQVQAEHGGELALRESNEKDVSPEQLDALMASIGWVQGRGEKWREILSKSSFVYAAYDGEKLVGFGRAVDDGAMCTLYDIMVDPAYQGKGIGNKIMRNLLAYTQDKNFLSVSLFAWPKNKDFLISFYKGHGFKLFETAMRLEK